MFKSAVIVSVSVGYLLLSAAQPQASVSLAQHDMRMGEAEFAYLMAKHHQGGIEMAQVEEKGGSAADVKSLAAKIRSGQQSEVPKLKAHAKGQPSAMASQHEKDMQKEHMASMAILKGAKGAALDKAFAEEMIKHHQSALQMISQADLKDSELKQMADKMAANQKQEIAELQKVK